MEGKISQLNNKKSNNINSSFKSSFKRKNHPPYSLETKKIELTQTYNYGQNISFDIPLNGDLLYRCFFEITLPNIKIEDTIIEKISSSSYKEYTKYKQNLLSNIQKDIDYWNTKYTNLYNYVNIQLLIYIEAIKLLKINNFTIEFLQNRILTLVNKYEKLYDYQLLIDSDILDEINIVSYINSLNTSNDISNFSKVDEIITTIETNIKKKYDNINNYIKYYYSNKTYNEKKYKSVNEKNIYYKWIDNLAHYYFTFYEFNINGFVIDTYTNDYLHIYQKHHVHNDYNQNYNNITGNNEDIYNYTDYPKIIYTPLLFSFCDKKNPDNALPLISLQNSNLKINSKINSLQTLIYFHDWETEYNDILTIYIPRKDHSVNDNNTIIKKDFGVFTYESVELLLPEHIYKYTFKTVNKYVLDYTYTGIDSSSIISEYGIDDGNGNKVLGLNEWIYLKNNIKSNSNISDDTKILILGYHYFIDYNYLLNLIPKPNVSLILEYGYIDNVEKRMFASNYLEYLITTHHEVTLDLNNPTFVDSLNDITGLVKEMYYFSRLKLNKNGITKYSKSELDKYKDYSILSGNILDDIEINVSNEYNLVEYNDVKSQYNNVLTYLSLNSTLPDGVYYKSFSLYPEGEYNKSFFLHPFQPSGCINMTNITGQISQLL